MSYQYGQNSITTEEAVAFLQSQWISRCCTAASSTLVFYDQLNTLSREVEFMWSQRFSCASLLFHVNRLATLLWGIAVLLQTFLHYDGAQSCVALGGDLVQILNLILFALYAAFAAMRTYALLGGSWLLPAIVFVLGITPVGTNIYGGLVAAWYSTDVLPFIGTTCVSGVNYSEATSNILAITTRVSMIASDVIVLLVTWWKTFYIQRRADERIIKTPISTSLLRDGTIYFVIALCVNIINVLGLTMNFFANAAIFAIPISSMIVSHFFLNLRRIAYGKHSDSTNRQPSFLLSRPIVSRFVGNMGESLEFANIDVYEDDAARAGSISMQAGLAGLDAVDTGENAMQSEHLEEGLLDVGVVTDNTRR